MKTPADLLLEDPDTLVVRRRGSVETYGWSEPQSIPFICTYEGSVWSTKGGVGHRGTVYRCIESRTRKDLRRAGFELAGVSHFDRFQDLVDNVDNTLAGRVFLKPMVITFWDTRRDVLRKWMPRVRELLAAMELRPEDLKWEFLDYRHKQFAWGKLQTAGKEKRRSKEEMDMLRQLHLNPELKRKVIPKIPVNSIAADRAGFNNAASFNAARVVGDSLSE